jgi:hypothetical protein
MILNPGLRGQNGIEAEEDCLTSNWNRFKQELVKCYNGSIESSEAEHSFLTSLQLT